MAENKNSFVLYTDYINTFEELSDEEAGKLMKHILRYVNDKKPVAEDRIIKIAFEPIKQQLKRDLIKYEGIKQKRSIIGKAGGIKSGEVRKIKSLEGEGNESNTTKNEANEANALIDEANEAVNVFDNVIVNVNDTVIKKQTKKIFNQKPVAVEITDLPDVKIGSAIQLLKITKQVDVSSKRVIGMWDIFKVQNLTGKKFYATVEDVHSHFINWIKTQNFSGSDPPNTSKVSALIATFNQQEGNK